MSKILGWMDIKPDIGKGREGRSKVVAKLFNAGILLPSSSLDTEVPSTAPRSEFPWRLGCGVW